jgi:hypothetical protein
MGIGEFTGGGLNGLIAIAQAGWRGEDHSLSLNNFAGLVSLRMKGRDARADSSPSATSQPA